MLRFSKMHGLGNDFMMIDGVMQTVHLSSAQIAAWADRHTGVGFDQLLLLEKARDAKTDFYYRIFNSDGSEVEQCGNGARCVAHFIVEKKLSTRSQFIVGTRGGDLHLQLLKDGRVSVRMGVPSFEPAALPMLAPHQLNTYDIPVNDQIIKAQAISVGNPHCVITVEDADTAPVNILGPLIETHALFPQKVNVAFMQIIDVQHIKLRVYERGAGETRACGSGACAAVVAGHMQGKLEHDVKVSLPGGDLTINWLGVDHPVTLTGPASFVYDGEIFLGMV